MDTSRLRRPSASWLCSPKLPITIRHDADENAILRLARAHRLSVYDGAYLELAQRLAVAQATLDRALIAAAKAEGVALVGRDA